MNRGSVWLCDFGQPRGHEPAYQRPALVISPFDINLRAMPVVLPITRTKRGYPTHIELDGVLPITSYVQCELVRAVSRDRFIRELAEVDQIDLLRVGKVLTRILGL